MLILIFIFHTENWRTKDPAPNIGRQVFESSVALIYLRMQF